MIKTQVQIPEELYEKAKAVARQREMSLAEVMRRGLEYMTRTHPPISGKPFTLPKLDPSRFKANIEQLDLRAITLEDFEDHAVNKIKETGRDTDAGN